MILMDSLSFIHSFRFKKPKSLEQVRVWVRLMLKIWIKHVEHMI